MLEELDVPHQLERVEFRPQHATFAQATPYGRFPVLADGETVIGESGAILAYILERYGAGRDFLLGPEFSAADIMLGFTLVAARSSSACSTRAIP